MRYGDRLVVSTVNEISFVQHHYALDQIQMSVPSGMSIKLVKRKLGGDGSPDLQR